MRQMIILEPSDLDRLKAGEALQLTGTLMLSLQGTKKYKPRQAVDQTANPDEVRKAAKRDRQARYRARKDAGREGTPCKLGCGKLLGSAQAFGGHKAHCPNRRKP